MYVSWHFFPLTSLVTLSIIVTCWLIVIAKLDYMYELRGNPAESEFCVKPMAH